MLITESVTIKWSKSNIDRYTELGYIYTEIGDEFEIDINHLTHGSHKEIIYKCDYCNDIIKTTYKAYMYKVNNSKGTKDCCKNCIGKKSNETFFNENGYYIGKENIKTTLKVVKKKYGVDNINYIDGVAEKIGIKSKERKGELNSNWKGGVTPARMLLRSCAEYRKWKKSILTRDKHTCQTCGKSGDKMQAHHLYGFAQYEDSRYDTDNGVTLCKECHDDFHKIYGKNGDNTEEQFNEFRTNIEKGETTIETAS